VNGVELVNVTDEDEYFPPPRNIRDLQSSIETASTVMLGGTLLDRPAMDDRSLAASDVLSNLIK
jgi:4-hydroxy-3-methylbut-2-enyl diphosphate reductase